MGLFWVRLLWEEHANPFPPISRRILVCSLPHVWPVPDEAVGLLLHPDSMTELIRAKGKAGPWMPVLRESHPRSVDQRGRGSKQCRLQARAHSHMQTKGLKNMCGRLEAAFEPFRFAKGSKRKPAG